MEFLVGILIDVLLVRWGVLSARLREIDHQRAAHENQLASLTRRVRELEVVRVAPVMPAPATAPPLVAVPPPLPAPPAPLSTKLRVCQFCGRASDAATCVCGAVLDPSRVTHTPPPLPPPAPPRLPVAPAPAPVRSDWRDRLREKAGSQEWEAVVGGNWLNKLGVLVLVIGIALFLGYEFTRVGPAGRVAIGAAVSLTMLLGGVLLERRPLYQIFGRGLIGGGWAALYFTTFAMHAVPAARVIENVYLGSAVLLAVALGMILHSLRYQSQTVSGLAYFIAFATLGLSESTPFSVLALIPLAASLLVLAYRFDWQKMAVFGVVATFATCATRPDTGAPLASTQALFSIYWLLFETFDLLRLRRRAHQLTVESLIAPLNALGFLGLSAVKWQRSAAEHLYAFLAAGAALYLASGLLRVRISPPSTFAEDTGTGTRMAAGSYEGPLTLAALLAALAVFRKLAGVWIQVGLLIEGEALFLAGLQFGQTYLRQLAGAVFGASVIQLAASDVPAGGTMVFAGRSWMLWSPAAILTAGVFYLNRILRQTTGNRWSVPLYSSAAAGLIALVLGFETPQPYLCLSWLVFAALLFEFGFRKGKTEFRWQSYAVGLLGTAAGVRLNVVAGLLDRQWIPIAISGAIHYAAALRIRFGGIERLNPDERDMVPFATSASATTFFAALVWKLAPGDYLGVAWLALGAVLFELGLRNLPKHFRWQSYFVSLLGFSHLFYFRVMQAEKGAVRAEWLSLALAALICYAVSTRLLRAAEQEQGWARDLNAAAATLFVLTLEWVELPDVLVAPAWAVISLVLIEIGFSVSLVSFRTLGNLTGAAVFGRLFLANFTGFGNTAGISHRILTVVPIMAAQYYVWSRYRRAPGRERSGWESNVARLYLYAPAILGVVLLRFELGRSLAVVGWALFGLALYRTGLVRDLARDLNDLRWQSYAIAALAFWRSWNTNFYIPESLAGISGRVLTGAIVIASFYVAQLITPRESPRESREARLARTFYSLLASVLLAVLLFYEVSGGVLTVAWGGEAMALLAAGFPLRDRFQRLSGLFLFLICVLKLFLYDLRQLETINRILSFIALGLILVSVSWIYTRFRSRLQRYL